MPKVALVGLASHSRIMSHLLQRLGCLVREFPTPYPALSFIEQCRLSDGPDLIIAQLPLSGMDGFEFVHRLQRYQSCRDTPICLVAENERVIDRIRAWRPKVTYRLLPIEFADLLSLLPSPYRERR